MRRRSLGIGLTALVIAIVAVAAIGGAGASLNAFGSASLLQCENGRPVNNPPACDWQGGNLNGQQNTYNEGMSTPQKILITGLKRDQAIVLSDANPGVLISNDVWRYRDGSVTSEET